MRNPSTPPRPALGKVARQAAPQLQRTSTPSLQKARPRPPLSAQGAQSDPSTASPEGILQLQRLAGNQAVSGLLSHTLQAKLMVGPSGDSYEQEADRVAEHVVGMPEGAGQVHGGAASAGVQAKPLAASITPLVQRDRDPEDTEEDEAKGNGEVQGKLVAQRAGAEDEEEPPIQSKRGAEARFAAGKGFERGLAASRGGGSPLSEGMRAYMEPRFGTDFSGVRVHTGSEALQLSRAIGARAFTQGRDIYVGQGGYDPGTVDDRRLLAHELTHVVQQSGAGPLQPTGAGEAHAQQPVAARMAEGAPQVQRLVDVEIGMMQGLRGRFLSGRTGRVIKLLESYNQFMHSGRAPGDLQRDQLLQALDLLFQIRKDRARSRWSSRAAAQLPVLLKVIDRVLTESQTLNSYREVKAAKRMGAGQMATVWQTLFGDGWKAVFKADQEDLREQGPTVTAFKESGLPLMQANTAGRNMAMYALDQLLGTGVMPRTERAYMGEEAGVVMEKVKGVSLGGIKRDALTREPVEVTADVSLARPELQRGLSNLQMLDAICGQIDRHRGNVFVQVDGQGRIVGIKGVDNDLAFGTVIGAGWEGTYNERKENRGVPPFVDLRVAENIERVTAAQVRQVLQGLLTGEEVEATVGRFLFAQGYCHALLEWRRNPGAPGAEPPGRLVSQWDQGTYDEQMRQAQQATAGEPDSVKAHSYLYDRQSDIDFARERAPRDPQHFQFVPIG